ncbi:P-loop containing nucleoside triphosphate hydrolase protein [Boletus edulis BED1]|uniref:P-loop containing nucleoside triphosphate hydrolase protein n=1 Tax=Boletus edulis BED1 TaxID=1328754 RepID=A0AAD4GJI8_BOLED|nr:P-loop containing nucleoside triphosphate hydrolase protein [Boletus edulis BED1]
MRSLSTHPADTLFRELAFLTEHLFLRATCTIGASGRTIFIRLYLIPNDLPNVHGRLHRRSETVVKEAQRHMHNIVPLIERNHGLWDADEACLDAPHEYFLPSHIDNPTMAEIYSDLPSPVLGPLMNENARLSRGIASGDAIWGLRTTLYGYQRHSVAIMLHRESSTSPVLDPLYIPVSCMTGFHCYVRPSTMTVLRECPTYSPSQAGILCEELGTGKTVMIIALVLATASQLADPEGSMVDHRPVMTPLAYLHFPSTEHALARDRAGLGQRVIQQVPSLVELLIHYFSSLKATTGRPAFADELKATHLWPVIQANKPFYHHYKGELLAEALKRSSRRAATNLCPRTMYPSTATLVVVPLALLDQWKTEIDKHCYDNVRYLIVRRSMDLPDAKKLASDYEVSFRMESKKNKTEKLHDLKPCTCPCLAESRVPDCHCLGDCNVTPLLQVRWKRLVIDEGHIAGNTAATINYFVQELSIQHKWIVTGTPTSNLLGLQLGRTTDEEDFDLVYPDSDSPEDMSSTQDEGHRDMRIWGSYDRQNLRKLGTMIGDFLSVPQFRTDTKCFKHHVSTLLCDQRGPRPGAIDVLTQVMQMVMVRHRIEDVESDVLLPPMRHDIIRMDLDGYALKSYNAMQAALAINAIDSEREGTDYLFHPSKAQELQTTINNSLQGLFWSASDILYNVDQICDLADEFIARAVRRQVDPKDLDLLQQALKHASTAAKDKMWRAMQPYADVPFKLSGLDPDVFEAWTQTELCDGSRTIDVMHPDRLMELRSLVRKKPLISRDKLVEEGKILDRKEKRMMASKSTGARQAKRGANQRKEMEKEVQGKIKTLKEHVERMTEDEEVEDCQDGESVISTKAAAARTLVFSPLSGVKVGPSVSTKLNYILSEIQEYSAKEKFLIFSNSLLTLYQVGEALSLFEIKYLRYTNQEKYLLREQCITTFETSDVYRVLLMELKRGARGLNLISASRIIFCEPVWHPDVESQAIKRAHRIGQTRPVTAKTLVIRSTAEEEMIARRQYLRSSDKVPNMTTESGMRQYLQVICNPFLNLDVVYRGSRIPASWPSLPRMI